MTEAPLPQPRKRDPEEKRERLLHAARALFVEQGYDKTTTKQIAKRAGVSEGILFHQFDSKIGLFKELVRIFAEGAVAEFTVHPSDTLTFEDVIRRIIAFSERDRSFFKVIDQNAAVLKKSGMPTVPDIVIPAIEQSIRAQFPDIEKLSTSPEILAEFHYSIVETSYRGWLKSTTEERKEAFIKEGVRCMNALVSAPQSYG